MPTKGRPRLTPEQLQARVDDYCHRYRVVPNAAGLPPFPSGKRETVQHREWLLVYKTHQRLSRRLRGRCERCDAVAEDGSIFCARHHDAASAADTRRLEAPDVAAGAARSSPRARAGSGSGSGSCPVCREPVDAGNGVRHTVSATGRHLLLHEPCLQLLSLAERSGPEQVLRAFACLWPRRRGEVPR